MKNLLKLAVSIGFLLQACAMAQAHEPKALVKSRAECVVLLHGLVRTSNSMNKMQQSLEAAGYKVRNWSYPSRELLIEMLAENAIRDAVESCRESSIERVSFVTHSTGGILVRYYLATNAIDDLGRVVMISPPNQGSELVDKLSNWPGFELINGPAGYQLGTDENSVPLQLGLVNFEAAVITGNKTTNLLFSVLIPGEDDGKVSVESARLEGMADFLVVPEAHSFIMRDDEVIEQMIHFLDYGYFERDDRG